MQPMNIDAAINELTQVILGLSTVAGIFLAGFMCGFGEGRKFENPVDDGKSSSTIQSDTESRR
jgi:hypothetical protein